MHTVVMPKLSDTMEEGKILSWLKQEGDQVAKGDSLAEIETDKVNIEVEAFSAGVLRKILVPAGSAAPVGAPIALTGAANEAIPAEFAASAPPQKAAELAMPVASSATAASMAISTNGQANAAPEVFSRPVAQPATAGAQNGATPASVSSNGHSAASNGHSASVEQVTTNGRRFISPIARHIAAEHTIDLATLTGSGPNGRIIRDDVEAYLAQQRA